MNRVWARLRGEQHDPQRRPGCPQSQGHPIHTALGDRGKASGGPPPQPILGSVRQAASPRRALGPVGSQRTGEQGLAIKAQLCQLRTV